MEIKSVKKVEIEYPKINEISNKKLKSFIPNKWMKLGIISQPLAGDIANIEEISAISYTDTRITLGTIILFVISILGLFLTKNNKKQKNKSLNNLFKIMLITSVLLFIIWQIVYACL